MFVTEKVVSSLLTLPCHLRQYVMVKDDPFDPLPLVENKVVVACCMQGFVLCSVLYYYNKYHL